MLVSRKRTRIFYGFFSSIFDAINPIFYTNHMRRRLIDAARISDGDLVLDVGAGTAYTTVAAAQRCNCTVIGGDLSPEMLRRGVVRSRQMGVSIPLVLSDAHHLPFKSDTFDALISAGVIEYWRDPVAVLREMREVAKYGGRVVVLGPRDPTTPLLRQLASLLMRFVGRDELVAFFHRAGLREVKAVTVGPRVLMSKLAVICCGFR